MVASLDVLLGVVPGAAGVGHEHGHGKTGDGHAAQQTHNARGPQDQTGGQGDQDRQQGGSHHLVEGALGAQSHALGILGIGLVVHDARDLAELAADLHHDGLGGLLHGAHGESGEHEGQHGADKQSDQNGGTGEGEVQSLWGLGLHDVNIGHQQGQRGQGGGADGEALAGGGGGVAQGVQRVGALPDFLGKAAHLGNAAGVVGHGAVSVGSQSDAQGGEHAHAGDADAVQTLAEVRSAAGGEEADDDSGADDQDGSHGGLEAQGDAADDDGGGTGLGGRGQLLGGLIVVGGVVLGEVADGGAADQAAEDGHVDTPAVVGGAEDESAEGSGQDRAQDSGGVSAGAQALEQAQLGGVFLGLHQEGADQGADDAADGQSQRQEHAGPAVAGHRGQSEGGENGAHIALVQVSAHTGHVAHVVAHVVGDGGGVAGVILGDAGFDLSHEVGAHVGGLGVDTAAHTGEQRHEGGAHAVHDHDVGDDFGIGDAAQVLQAEEPQRDVQNAQTHHGEAHDGTGGEGHVQTSVQALMRGVGRAGVGVGGDLHADQAGQHGPDAAGEEREGRDPGEHLSAGGEGYDDQNDEYDSEYLGDRSVLALQVSVGTLTDGSGDLHHLLVTLRVLHDFVTLQQGEDERHRRTDKADPEEVFQ